MGIYDATEDEDTGERIGMALIGNNEIHHELRVRQAAAYSQVADRVVRWEHVTAIAAQMDDMKLIFADVDNDQEALKLLHQISTSVSIRNAVQAFIQTLIAFQIKDYADVTATKLARVAKDMNIRMAA